MAIKREDLQSTDFKAITGRQKLPAIHPGTILFSEFMEPLDISQNGLAKAISVSPRAINEIVHGKRSITANTALRLAKYFGTSAKFWMGLQASYDLETTDVDLTGIVHLAGSA